jgi:hypothetical protein
MSERRFVARAARSMLRGMQSPAIVFTHTGLTVHASQQGERWHGELLNEHGELQDAFAYTRETFPGAVIGALRFPDITFALELAARMWLHTDTAE